MAKKEAEKKKKPEPQKPKKQKSRPGEQMDLIDIGPVQKKQILQVARAYKKAVRARMAVGDEEKQLKNKLLGMVRKENLTPLEDGSVKFELDGVKISVTPRDELIKVKFPEDEE